METRSRLSKHLLISLLIQGVYTVVSPLSMILLARFLGPDQFGEFSFVVSFVIIISIFAHMGFPIVITRYGAIYFVKKDWPFLKGIIQFVNRRVFVAGLILLGICAGLVLLGVFGTVSKMNMIYGLPIILFLALSNVRTGVLTAIEKVNLAQLPEMIIRPILFIIVVLAFYFGGILNASNAIISYTFINLAVFLVGVYLVRRFTAYLGKEIVPSTDSSSWIRSATPLFLLGAAQVLGAQADVFLLGLLADSDEVGIFKSMYQISMLVLFSLSAVNAISAPYIVRSFENKQYNKLKKLLITFCAINGLFGFLIALPFIVKGEFLIELVYGKAYVSGLSCLYILLIGRVLNSFMGIAGMFLKMMGEEKKAALGIILGTIVGVTLNFVLIPSNGIIGAAIASAAGLATWNIYLFVVAVKSIWRLS